MLEDCQVWLERLAADVEGERALSAALPALYHLLQN